MEKIHYLKETGEVRLRKSKRARRISIRITPAGKVSVTLPWYGTWDAAIHFLEQKKTWVKKTLARLEKNRPERPDYHPGENRFTRRHRLILLPDEKMKKKIHTRLSVETVTIRYPAGWQLSAPSLQQTIATVRIHTLREEARSYLPGRLSRLARLHGYSYQRLFLKNLKTRWGSCSAAGNINLNIRLMELPDHLIDYVLLHELAHTLHKHHGPAFWNELENTAGNARKLDKELNNYHICPDF